MSKISNKKKNISKQDINHKHDVAEFCITKKLFLDFEAKLSYKDFVDDRAPQDTFNSGVSIRYGDGRAKELDEVLELLEKMECLDEFKKESGQIITSLKNLIIFSILKQCVYSIGNDFMRKEIGDLLRGDIKERYYSNDAGCLGTIETLKTIHDTDKGDFNLWSTYIKYRNANGKRWLTRPYENFPIPLNGIDGGCFKVVKYEEYIERNDVFAYIIFCTIALHKNLYLVYSELLHPVYVGVVEKARLDKYLFAGMFIIDISSIIKQIFCNVFKGTELAASILRANKFEKIRNMASNDLRNDTGDKNKATANFTIECGIPTFMSVKLKDTDVNNYKKLKEWVGENGEIGQKISKGKCNTITAKKQYVYGDKDDIKALKKMKKK